MDMDMDMVGTWYTSFSARCVRLAPGNTTGCASCGITTQHTLSSTVILHPFLYGTLHGTEGWKRLGGGEERVAQLRSRVH